MIDDLFPEIVSTKTNSCRPCEHPYFVVGYWPRGEYWSVFPAMFSNPESNQLNDFVREKIRCGWTHVTIMKLPPTLWEL